MKKVNKNYNNQPGILISPAAEQVIVQSLVEKDKHSFRLDIYRHPSVLAALTANTLYNNKCAFCESDTSAGAPMQVEHYRPKAYVTGQNAPSGYYWLGYNWTNLLLACSSCNNKKRNNFPIEAAGTRVLTHPILNGQLDVAESRADSATLLGESALIINPELESDTRIYFAFQPNGRIEARNNFNKARTTILCCGLNRDNLVTKRKKFYDDLFNKFIKHFAKFKDGIILINELRVLLLDTIEDLVSHLANNGIYFEFAWTCWTRFPEFFVNRFQPEEARILNDAYQAVVELLINE